MCIYALSMDIDKRVVKARVGQELGGGGISEEKEETITFKKK